MQSKLQHCRTIIELKQQWLSSTACRIENYNFGFPIAGYMQIKLFCSLGAASSLENIKQLKLRLFEKLHGKNRHGGSFIKVTKLTLEESHNFLVQFVNCSTNCFNCQFVVCAQAITVLPVNLLKSDIYCTFMD